MKDFLEHLCCVYFEAPGFRRAVETGVSPALAEDLSLCLWGIVGMTENVQLKERRVRGDLSPVQFLKIFLKLISERKGEEERDRNINDENH